MWWVTPDGTRVGPAADGWYDATLQIPCRVDLADDGTPRCLPRSILQAVGGSDQEFADAQCTQPATFTGAFPGTCPLAYDPETSAWAQVAAASTNCEASYAWAPVTNWLSEAVVYSRYEGGPCLGNSSLAPMGYTVGPAAPASTFAAFSVPTPQGTGRLQSTVSTAEDGATALAGIWDSTLGVGCNVEKTSDGTVRCLPPITSIGFTDAACTKAVIPSRIAGDPSCGVTPSYGFDGRTNTYYRPGSSVPSPAAYYSWDGSACAVQPTQGVVFYAVGAPLRVSDFAQVHDVALTTGRIVEHGWADEGGVVAQGVSLHDVQLDIDVTPGVVDEKTSALLPTNFISFRYFADAACSQPLADGVTKPSYAFIESSDSVDCDKRQVLAVGDEVHPGQVFQKDYGTGGCDAAAMPSDALYALTAVPASTFVPAVIVTE